MVPSKTLDHLTTLTCFIEINLLHSVRPVISMKANNITACVFNWSSKGHFLFLTAICLRLLEYRLVLRNITAISGSVLIDKKCAPSKKN